MSDIDEWDYWPVHCPECGADMTIAESMEPPDLYAHDPSCSRHPDAREDLDDVPHPAKTEAA